VQNKEKGKNVKEKSEAEWLWKKPYAKEQRFSPISSCAAT